MTSLLLWLQAAEHRQTKRQKRTQREHIISSIHYVHLEENITTEPLTLGALVADELARISGVVARTDTSKAGDRSTRLTRAAGLTSPRRTDGTVTDGVTVQDVRTQIHRSPTYHQTTYTSYSNRPINQLACQALRKAKSVHRNPVTAVACCYSLPIAMTSASANSTLPSSSAGSSMVHWSYLAIRKYLKIRS